MTPAGGSDAVVGALPGRVRKWFPSRAVLDDRIWLPALPGAVSAANDAVCVADPGAGQVSRIDPPGTGPEAALVPVGGEPGHHFAHHRGQPHVDGNTADGRNRRWEHGVKFPVFHVGGD
jgi:hypothetical protein